MPPGSTSFKLERNEEERGIMRYMKIYLVLLFILVSGAWVVAQTQTAPAAGVPAVTAKIGFIDSTAILQGTAEGKQQLADLEAYVTERRKKLEEATQELEQIRRQYTSQARMFNPATAAEMQKTITDKEKNLRRMQEDMELDVTSHRNEVLNTMSQKIQAVVAEYAQANSYDIIFLENPNIPYFSPALDLTASIIQAYDKKHPVGSAAAGTQGQ